MAILIALSVMEIAFKNIKIIKMEIEKQELVKKEISRINNQLEEKVDEKEVLKFFNEIMCYK